MDGLRTLQLVCIVKLSVDRPGPRRPERRPSLKSPTARLAIALFLFGGLLWADPSGQHRGRYFTVRDSIEMARFVRNEHEPKFSPDGKHFAVVTSRGILHSNEIESTLWVFGSEEVQELLRVGNGTKQCAPMIAARVAAVPQQQYFDSYEPLITELRWLPDSKGILFLAQRADGQRELRQVTLASRTVRSVTPGNYDVMQFGFARGAIVYAAQSRETTSKKTPFESEAVTGVPLTDILFPGMSKSQQPVELWFARNGRTRKVVDPISSQVLRLAKLPLPQSVMALSSDGQTAVVLVPSRSIPKLWESYVPSFAYLQLHSSDSEATKVYWPAQYGTVDLSSGKLNILVDAPNAWALGSADTNQAVWTSDGKKLLLTNTYLPLDTADMSEKSKRLHHCAAVVVERVSKTSDCVVFSDSDRAKRHLLSASFGEDDRQVILTFWNSPNTITHEEYRYTDGAWHFVRLRTDPKYQAITYESSEPEGKGFSVTIKQDLNTPPALWVVGRETAQKKIWDPNPQLAALNLGEASEFRWKDKTGHEWIGGLVRPPDYVPGNRYPLVIQTHGFQADEFMTDGAYTTAFAARPLAAAGMVVLQVPTRHDHPVSEAEASDQIEGFRSAIERLAADGLIDPERVGIIGFSRTCYYVETALITDPKLFTAATIADGVDESYMQYLLFGIGKSNDEPEQIYGHPPFGNSLKDWIDQAPGFHLDRVLTPVRIEAIGPGSVLAEWEIYASLWKQGKPVDLIYLPDGDHILQKPLERLASQQGDVEWFRFWLKGEEDSDPKKAAQFVRWKRMRMRYSAESTAQ